MIILKILKMNLVFNVFAKLVIRYINLGLNIFNSLNYSITRFILILLQYA